ncbi:hypothetical protein HY946_01120, partial [Candidatus Gottesmanbacteria bacterium]|nr:hypothetical protein [Candidatus Gottesmanbacteria bacterium]
YGYPLFVFSYQSPWFIGIPLLRLGLSLTDSVKGVFIIGFVISGVAMAVWLREMWGLFPALTGSILYLWAPYRFSNIFVRASLGEATAFMFVPLLFWGIWKCRTEKRWRKGVILTSLGLAGIILSHLMVLIVFALPLILWVLIQLYESLAKKESLKKIIIGLLLGIGLSSYYLIPAIGEKQSTMASQILQSHYLDHFTTLGQLIYSKWGYGFDFPGTVNDAMSFQIGIAQWVAIVFLLALMVWTLFKKKKTDSLLLFSFFSFIFSIIMMLSISKPVWEQISKFAYFDFPWRFLSLAVFIGSLAAALMVKTAKKIGWLIAIFLILLAFYTNRNHLRVNQYVYQPDSFYINNLQTTNMFDEYRPKTIDGNYIKVKRERFEVERKRVTIDNQIIRSNYLLLEGKADGDTKIKINTTYYPGWRAWVNGVEQKTVLAEDGTMETLVPKGQFTVKAKFTNTPIRMLSNFVSLISVFLLVFLVKL